MSVIEYMTPERRAVRFPDMKRKVGDTLTVLYLPAEPDRAKPYDLCWYRAAKPGA